jgi:nitrogen fixation NifU-like protein
MYSDEVLDHFRDPRNIGTLDPADAVGRDGIPGQGNYLVIYLRTHGDRIEEATFETYGCPAAIACGSYVSQWSKSKTVEEADGLDGCEVAVALDLPLGKEHCAQLAVNALRDALEQLRAKG